MGWVAIAEAGMEVTIAGIAIATISAVKCPSVRHVA
jgi:hypothetical protein